MLIEIPPHTGSLHWERGKGLPAWAYHAPASSTHVIQEATALLRSFSKSTVQAYVHHDK
jgi:hypothetical protein